MNRLWAHLITRQKALWKSATIWLSAIVMSLPDILTYAQANFPTIAGYLPQAWHDRSLSLIGLAIFLCRMRSLVRVPPEPGLPPPVAR